MTLSSILIQLLNGLAAASSLFLVSAGLSLIFGVTRIVNFAHGSLYMLGLYGAYSLIELFGRTPLGFWSAVVLAALAVGLVGILIELTVLRRIYRAPELFQLLATFAIVLIIKDIALFTWGAEDLVGPRAPGLSMAVEILGKERDLSGLIWLRQRGPRLMARLNEGGAFKVYTISAKGIEPMGANLPRALHEGNFAGVWSGLMVLITALGLGGLMVTGLILYARRALRPRQRNRAVPVAS